jgi:hypothetical protein
LKITLTIVCTNIAWALDLLLHICIIHFLLTSFYHKINQDLCCPLKIANKGWWTNLGFKVKNKLGVPIKFIILKIWSRCVAWLLLEAMTYLLVTFKCHNKLHIYFLKYRFCGLIIMLSKSEFVFH